MGRSHAGDFPAEVAALPSVTEPRSNVSGSGAEIDARVRAAVSVATGAVTPLTSFEECTVFVDSPSWSPDG